MSDNKQDDGVKVGGAYVENENHVPNPADMYGTFNTSGVGPSGDLASVSPIFETDKNATAREILNSLDPENPTSSDRVIFGTPQAVVTSDHDGDRDRLKELAEARVNKEVVVGGPSPIEQEAAKTGDEGTKAAEAEQIDNGSTDGAVTGVSTPTVAPAAAPAAPAAEAAPAPVVAE